ncbi:MAG TPA: alpha-amylase, partial [Cytophagales bacterium]|nr:alpha-amylase [Cytophagales bacterium]
PLDDVDVVKGRLGSPYAIKDYYDVNPYLAEEPDNRMAEFDALVERTHAAGLKVLIDFVPNHVARSYASDAKPAGVVDFGANDDVALAFSPTNNFYYLPGEDFVVPSEHNPGGPNELPTEDGTFAESPAKATGNDGFTATPQNWDWFETIKLNYGVDYQNDRTPNFDPVPDTWHKMLHILNFWASRGVDGVRCDMAEMVPVEFWEWVIPKVKAQAGQEFTFIAEIYNPTQYGNYLDRGQFDYLYDKVQLYDSLKAIIQGRGSVTGITDAWQDLKGYNGRMLRFLENHDEQRIASPDFAGNAWKGLPMMVVSATMHTGPVLVYFGQEVGEPGEGKEGFQGEDGRTTIFDFWGVPQHQKWMNGGAFDGGELNEEEKELRGFYQEILKLVQEPVFAQGDFYDLHASLEKDQQGQVYSCLRHHEGTTALVAANFSNESVTFTTAIPEEVREAWKLSVGAQETGAQIVPGDAFGQFEIDQLEDVEITLPPYGSVVISTHE